METPLEKLYTEHVRALHRYAVGLIGDIDEASDIVQTVFTRLATKAKQSTMPTPITKAYLFTAVKNGAKDYWKRIRPVPLSHMTLENDEGDAAFMDIRDDTPGPLEQAEARSEIDSVLQALQFLTEEQREVISLKYFSGFSAHEIAGFVGKNENAVRQMEFRALSSLRRILKKSTL